MSATTHNRRPEPVPSAVIFACLMSVGAQNFPASKALREHGRDPNAISGVVEGWKDGRPGVAAKFALEAYAPTRQEIERVIGAYLRRYPTGEFETRFCKIEEVYDGFRAIGDRARECA
jgi:hypothetical protein